MERILHISGSDTLQQMNGIANFIMNIYRNIDKEKYQFDFLVYGTKKGSYDDEIRELGGRIYHVVSPGQNLIENAIQTYKILKANQYRIIHRHTASSLCWMDFVVSRIAGIKVRISHSHGSFCEKEKMHKLFYPIFIYNVTHKIACGVEAGRWLYRNNDSFFVQKNGINSQKFSFNEKQRKNLRKKLEIDDNTILIGNIGRLSYEKNQLFLVEIFKELAKKTNYFKFAIVGDGPVKEKIIEKISELDIKDQVLLPGAVENVSEWLSALDAVVYPSLMEGFPIAVLESQASGLPSVLSDKIPKEIDVTGLSLFVSLEEGAEYWAKKIVKHLEKYEINNRERYYQYIIDAGYDIKQATRELEDYYEKALEKYKYKK